MSGRALSAMLTVSQLSKSFTGRELFVGGNDEPVSIVAVHANIAFDFVELKLDAVLHDG
jgi:hypothetical protein